ncbi:hypothetical protein HWI79_1849 [Cryptosporidium felis]|nr:hypothetical protein HWI79_1849 [Cryptosporidium felis]
MYCFEYIDPIRNVQFLNQESKTGIRQFREKTESLETEFEGLRNQLRFEEKVTVRTPSSHKGPSNKVKNFNRSITSYLRTSHLYHSLSIEFVTAERRQ